MNTSLITTANEIIAQAAKQVILQTDYHTLTRSVPRKHLKAFIAALNQTERYNGKLDEKRVYWACTTKDTMFKMDFTAAGECIVLLD